MPWSEATEPEGGSHPASPLISRFHPLLGEDSHPVRLHRELDRNLLIWMVLS